MMLQKRGLMGGGDISARSYVQNGLISMWDGIENVGWGIHSNDSNIWKDLVGSKNLTISANGSFLEDHFVSNGDNAAYYDTTFDENEIKTLEIVARFSGTLKRAILLIGSGYNFKRGAVGRPGYEFIQMVDTSRTADKRVIPTNEHFCKEKFSISCIYEDGYKTKDLYANGNIAEEFTFNNNFPCGEHFITVGGIVSHPWDGDIWSIRCYSTQLTESEISRNHSVDQARFGVP